MAVCTYVCACVRLLMACVFQFNSEGDEVYNDALALQKLLDKVRSSAAPVYMRVFVC